jgi:hypothetical protein
VWGNRAGGEVMNHEGVASVDDAAAANAASLSAFHLAIAVSVGTMPRRPVHSASQSSRGCPRGD